MLCLTARQAESKKPVGGSESSDRSHIKSFEEGRKMCCGDIAGG